MRSMGMRKIALALALALCLLAPASALGSTASTTGSTLNYLATAGEKNDVTISHAGDTITITESGNAPGGGGKINVTAAGTCTATGGGSSATCPAAGITLVNVELSDQNDQAVLNLAIPSVIRAGDGTDVITGGGGGDQLFGDEGNDTVNGGGGDDKLFGGGGPDQLNGGDGIDTVDYSSATTPVTVTIDGNAGDGPSGESDNVNIDVENVIGGSAGDSLTGSSAANGLFGGPGDDTLDGGAGPDTLDGGDGRDRVSYASSGVGVTVTLDGVANDGGPGENDNLVSIEDVSGSALADLLGGSLVSESIFGGAGNDRIAGGLQPDTLDGGPGDDAIQAFDRSVDNVNCGEGGADAAIVDANDVVAGCEIVQKGKVLVVSSRVPVRRGIARVGAKCPSFAVQGCNGSLTLKVGRTTAGKRALKLAPSGKRVTLKVRLSRKGRAALRRSRRGTASVFNRDFGRAATTVRSRVRYR